MSYIYDISRLRVKGLMLPCKVAYFYVRVSIKQASNAKTPCCTLGISNATRSTSSRNYSGCNMSEAVLEDFPVLFTKLVLCECTEGSKYMSVFISVLSHE